MKVSLKRINPLKTPVPELFELAQLSTKEDGVLWYEFEELMTNFQAPKDFRKEQKRYARGEKIIVAAKCNNKFVGWCTFDSHFINIFVQRKMRRHRLGKKLLLRCRKEAMKECKRKRNREMHYHNTPGMNRMIASLMKQKKYRDIINTDKGIISY